MLHEPLDAPPTIGLSGEIKRLVVVVDRSMVLEAIGRALRHGEGFQLVGLLDGRTPTASVLAKLRPDVIVIDEMQRPEIALARLREAAEHAPKAKRLLLTARMDERWLGHVLDAGADGVLSKAVPPESMGTLLYEMASGHLVQRFQRAAAARKEPPCPLSRREREILGLTAEGFTNQQIARELWVTEQTVKFHLSNLYRKLGVGNRTEASRYAYLHGLIAPPRRLAS